MKLLRMHRRGYKNSSNCHERRKYENVNECNYHIIIIHRSEIEFLEQAVIKEREKYQLSTQALSSGLSAIPVMTVNDSVIYFLSQKNQKSSIS